MNSLQRASIFTLGIIFSFVLFIFILIGLYTDSISLPTAVFLTILFNFLTWALGPFFSDFLYRWIYKVKFLTRDEMYAQYTELFDFIDKVCKQYNFKFPKIGFIMDRNPTAFTYGSTKNNARIIFTEGITHYLNIEEQKAVFAHELAHIHHNDFIIMTIAVTMIQILYEVYAAFTKNKKGSSKKEGKNLAWIGMVSYVFYLIGSYLILYLSRVREYYADNFAAQVTRSPHALSQALVKIAYGIVQAEDTDASKRLLESTKTMGIMDSKTAGFITGVAYVSADPQAVAEVMAFDIVSPWAKILELSSTHPLTGKRLLALENIAKSLGKKKLLDFEALFARMNIDKNKLFAKFFIESCLYFAPVVLPFPGFVLGGIGGAMIGFAIGSLINIFYRMPNGKATASNILDQLKNVYASPMHGIPVALEGKVVGRGVAGYVFSEDMMFQDKSGLSYLDYNSLFGFLGNFFFAIGKIKKLMGQEVSVEGWFFRGISHHITLRKINYLDKKIHSYPRAYGILINILILVAGLFLYNPNIF